MAANMADTVVTYSKMQLQALVHAGERALENGAYYPMKDWLAEVKLFQREEAKNWYENQLKPGLDTSTLNALASAHDEDASSGGPDPKPEELVRWTIACLDVLRALVETANFPRA